MTNKVKGYIMGSIAAATYGMNPLFALPLYSDGLSSGEVLLYRYIFAVVILLAMIKWRGQLLRIKRKTILPLAGLGIVMGMSSLLLFESYNYMAAGIASTMLFVYPLMVAIIMVVVYHERISMLTIFCIITALLGILLLYKGEEGTTLSGIGTLLVMLSALSYAIYLVWVNRSAFKDIPTLVLTFYVILFGLSIFIVQALFKGEVPQIPSAPLYWGCAFALGLLPTAISLICTTISIQNIGSTPTAILGAIEPVTAVVIGIIVFGETLTGRDFLGLILILVAVTIVIAGDNISVVLLRMRKMFPAFYHRILHRRKHSK